MARKPNLKDKVFACLSLAKDMLIGVLTFDTLRIQLDWCLMVETIKGNFEIIE